MMDYLNQDHPVLRAAQARSYAVRELIERALAASKSFRLQFDRGRLEKVIGRETLEKVVPKVQDSPRVRRSQYEVHTGALDSDAIEMLRLLLAPEPPAGSERPLNYIRSVRLLDALGRTVLRGGDHNTFILFNLPATERAALIDSYRQAGIPESVIEKVDVDVEKLDP
jgi:hypothetical protein